MVNGALFVMTSGEHRMLKWFAGSLGFLYQVCKLILLKQ